MDFAKESLRLHYEWKGKIETKVRLDMSAPESLGEKLC